MGNSEECIKASSLQNSKIGATVLGGIFGTVGALGSGVLGAVDGMLVGSVAPGRGIVIGGVAGFFTGLVIGAGTGAAVGKYFLRFVKIYQNKIYNYRWRPWCGYWSTSWMEFL